MKKFNNYIYAIFATTVLISCGGGGGGGGGGDTPTMTLSTDLTQVVVGQVAVISWSSNQTALFCIWCLEWF
jgi:hypothetical protein